MPVYKMKCTKCGRVVKECLVESILLAGDTAETREPCPKCGNVISKRLCSLHQVADMSVAWAQECRGDGGRYNT